MKCNTQSIEILTTQFTGIIQAELEAGESYGIREIKTEMRRWLQALGQKTLGMLLSQAEGVPERQLRCESGGTLHYQRRRGAQMQSVFGWVQYRRSYDAGCRCGQGHAPVDSRFGLQAGQMTAGLAALVGQAGAQMGFDHNSRFLEPYLLFQVLPNSIRKETQGYGYLQAGREAEWQADSQD